MYSTDAPVARHRAARTDKTPPLEEAASRGAAVAVNLQQANDIPAGNDGITVEPAVPNYLRDTYTWAYLRPGSVRLLDRPSVVNAILWGNYPRLLRTALAELSPGQSVYQPACVYGDFSERVAELLGPDGHLEVGDVAPVQVANCRRKLGDRDNVSVRLQDAADKHPGDYDVVCCFFLLHEIPEDYKRRVVDSLLNTVRPGGKVVFVDYHGPHRLHPLKLVMRFVNYALEPFAYAMWVNEVSSYASKPDAFSWSKQTFFGGMYQKVVAERQS